MMKRAAVIVAFLVLTAGAAWAGKEAYKLVMSKDKELCTGMLKLFNEDMKQYKEIRYDKHDTFVRWEPVELGGNAPLAKSCSIFQKSKFDINNDGKEDLVVKWSACLRDQLTDSLYIHPADSDAFSNVTWQEHKALFNTQEKVELAEGRYYLKELPKGKKGELTPRIAGVLVLQPFMNGKTAYISMTDLHQDWIVIGKYKKADTLEDVCYFHGKSLIAQ